jgi:hypothetical protein
VIDVPAYSSNKSWTVSRMPAISGIFLLEYRIRCRPQRTHQRVLSSCWSVTDLCTSSQLMVLLPHRCFPTATSAKPLHFKLSVPQRIPCFRCDGSRPTGDRLARPCSERGHREELPDGYHQFRPHSFTGVVHLSHEYISDYLSCEACAHIF